MKFLRFALPVFFLSLSTAAFAQHEAHVAAATDTTAAPATPAAPAAQSDEERFFERLKTLAGYWEGPVTTTPKQEVQKLMAMDQGLPKKLDGTMKITIRVASDGYALTHETGEAGPHVNPLSVVYIEDGRLMMTHYCAFGNRPRMQAKFSPDGNTVTFDFVDISGKSRFGHMHQAIFTFIDEDHHSEDWVFYAPGDKPIRAHTELHRVK